MFCSSQELDLAAHTIRHFIHGEQALRHLGAFPFSFWSYEHLVIVEFSATSCVVS
jgi:hypothetical protein